ncbi:MAG: glycoside hydrolase family 28 protein [Tenuifilaceae bacterium]
MKTFRTFCFLGIVVMVLSLKVEGQSGKKILKLIGDGKTDQTSTIQNAIDSCSKAGGGTLVFPAGTYLFGPISLKSNVTLSLDTCATLLANDNEAVYQSKKGLLNIINGESLTNVSIVGKGVIDGNGKIWWEKFIQSGKKLQRPRLIYIKKSKNLHFEGITLLNSPSFHLVPQDCDGVVMTKLTFIAPDESPNTDAIDPSRSKNVKITHCIIDVGDDNVAIKAGRSSGQKGAVCENIEISDCVFLHGHGLSIGSETTNGVRNVTVKNCQFKGTTNGIRIKSNITLGGPVENVSYSNITMEDVKNPIVITFAYTAKKDEAITTDIPSVNGFFIKNLTVKGSKNAGKIIGLPESLLQNIELSDVNIQAQTGMILENAKGVKFNNVKIQVVKGKEITTTNVEGTGF